MYYDCKQKLLEAYNKGEPKAFDDVFNKHYQDIMYFIMKMVKDEDESKELTQLSFINLFNQRKQFDSLESIRSYLYTIAKNKCYDHFRMVKRQSTRFSKDSGDDIGEYGFELNIYDVKKRNRILQLDQV